MTLDKIFKDGDFTTARRSPTARATYEVKLTITKNAVTIMFRGSAYERFYGKRVVPIVFNTKNDKRIYFATEEKVNASDGNRHPGYTVSEQNNGKTPSSKIVISASSDMEKFKDFIGEYGKLHLDADCMLYFIERPTRF